VYLTAPLRSGPGSGGSEPPAQRFRRYGLVRRSHRLMGCARRQVARATGRRFRGASQRLRRGGAHAQRAHVRSGEATAPHARPVVDLRCDRRARRGHAAVLRRVFVVGGRPSGRGAGAVRRRRDDRARARGGHRPRVPTDAPRDAGVPRGRRSIARAVQPVLRVARAHPSPSGGHRIGIHRAAPRRHVRRVDLSRDDGRADHRRADTAAQRPGRGRERPSGARAGWPQRRPHDDAAEGEPLSPDADADGRAGAPPRAIRGVGGRDA